MPAWRDEAPVSAPAVLRSLTSLARVAATAIWLCLLDQPDRASAVSPDGSEFQVNTYTTGGQSDPSVASDSAGNFVVVWTNCCNVSTVQGQRHDANGSPIGGVFQINSYSANFVREPSVARDAAGDFAVVWTSSGGPGSDNSGDSVQGRLFAASGAPVSEQFQVNTYTTGSQSYSSVASDSAGNFVVVWQTGGSAGMDTSGYSVQGQRYDASGSPIGGQLEVNTYTTANQFRPSVASDSAGNFVVAWESDGSAGSDISGFSVQGRRYAANGAPIAGQFQINTYTFSQQVRPSVVSGSAGNFVVTWESSGSSGSDTSGFSVQGQRYDASGAPVGGQFQVNTYTTGDQSSSWVAGDSAGDFFVVWQGNGSAGGDTSFQSVHGRSYDASGSPMSGEFQVNTYTTSAQFRPTVASDSAGQSSIVVWQSSGSAGSDTSSSSVQGQRYLPEPAFGPSLGAMLAMVIVLRRRRQGI